MRRIYDLLVSFVLGYFFGLGALSLGHFVTNWPADYEQAAYLALISGAAAVGTKLYNQRLSTTRDS